MRSNMGPIDDKPIDLHVYQFWTRYKPDSGIIQTIVDLSCPKGFQKAHI